MTISSTETKTIYGGNGSTTNFAIPFMFTSDEDIEVVLTSIDGVETTQGIGTDYQLSGAGEQTGGLCVMSATPQSGETLVIRRSPAIVQEADYLENDAFPAASHEAALDKLTMICQALAERLDRTITFKVSSAVTGVELPQPDPGRMLAWNDAGDNLANRDIGELGGVLLPLPILQGGTGGDSATQALTNLGFGAAWRDAAPAETTLQALAAIDAEQADPAIVKADLPDLLQTVYGDEAQAYSGSNLDGLTVGRNHIAWTLTGAGSLSDVALPYDGTYVFHVYPSGFDLTIASTYKTDGLLPVPDPDAGEIRLVIEQYNSRKSIISLQNLEA